MQAPRTPDDENERMQRLRALDILYTPASQAYDEVTRLARLRFDTAFALISLITEDEQWFKSADGLDACSTSREISFCGHAIHGTGVFVVEDAREDPRFVDNPLVTGPPHIRFYAGYPLRTGPGSALGTLCLIDTEPREFGADEIHKLERLGKVAENLLQEREQTLVLAADTLRSGRDLARWSLVEPITGNWTIQALEHLLLPSLAHARASNQYLGLFHIRFSDHDRIRTSTGDPGTRMMIKETARKIRAATPPLTAHFHDARGRFLALSLAGSRDSVGAIARSLYRELHADPGWDLLNLDPPGFDVDEVALDPQEVDDGEVHQNLCETYG